MEVSATSELSAPKIPECAPAVAILIAAAVATFDGDRVASRRNLLRASAILRARAPYKTYNVPDTQGRTRLARWQLNRLLDYIDQHLAEPITVQALASLVNLSMGYLSKAFKASVGVPPLQYVGSRRLQLVCFQLQTTAQPLSQIAANSGFCDQSHLCRVFRRFLGASPAAWRRENAKAPAADHGNRRTRVTSINAGDFRGASARVTPPNRARNRPDDHDASAQIAAEHG